MINEEKKNTGFKSCLFINRHAKNRAMFAAALGEVAPDTLCMLADNARDALYILQADGIVPDYIFAELNTPELDGMEFLEAVKKTPCLRNVPVVIHTDQIKNNQIRGLRERGVFAIYAKPYDYWSMCNVLNLYLYLSEAGINLN